MTLKKGARVVLLQNLEDGLVNGSQGEVIGFTKASKEITMMDELPGEHGKFRTACIKDFVDGNLEWRPVVHFTSGQTRVISAVADASIRGGPKWWDEYVVCRTQIPLTLAWALSIHKSQGMTLEYVEVSSKDIFVTGQLYVALSRATHLEGLRLTGFSRKQLPLDRDVLAFHTKTRWEVLGGDSESEDEESDHKFEKVDDNMEKMLIKMEGKIEQKGTHAVTQNGELEILSREKRGYDKSDDEEKVEERRKKWKKEPHSS